MHKVCHLTSVHPVFDVRIFYKQCISLTTAGYETYLIAPDCNDQVARNVNIIGVKIPKNKFLRIFYSSFAVVKKALNTKSALYHFHDPELMVCGVILKIFGKKVVFDVHENVRLSIKSKNWLPKLFRPLISWLYFLIERFCILFYDALVLAEESYLNYYPTKKSVIVLNYPIKLETEIQPKSFNSPIRFIYTGGVSENRGVWEMIKLVKTLIKRNVACNLKVVGQIFDQELKEKLKVYLKQNNLDELITLVGRIDFTELDSYYNKADIGLALLKPIDNYKESLPTKMFEYMQYGLPIIISNFPLYKRYIEESKAGITIDMSKFEDEIDEIERFAKNFENLVQGSQNGIKSINDTYNWTTQEEKVNKLYKSIFN